MKLVSENIRLDRFTSRHITPEYMGWINDADVNKYVDMGRIPVIREEVFVPDPNKTIMFAIMFVDGDISKYIGTATIHDIDWISRKARVGYMVGDKRCWGMGVATQTVRILIDYAFDRIGLNKLNASALVENIGSIKVLEKNGFSKIGIDPMDYYIGGEWIDNALFVKVRGQNVDK